MVWWAFVTPQAQSILELFRATGAYLNGHFRLTSGLHSPEYLQCALVLQYPRHAAEAGGLPGGKVRQPGPKPGGLGGAAGGGRPERRPKSRPRVGPPIHL